ncbi:protein involved in gliding motility RemB [Salegentibacter sp. 24]|uniref:gliding motility protein RemB n=1 Tax=Salegentibacter sp. 24 TaxID=2183986 RepID=UPI001060079C|nr:gliding motility protein RemB [Salegentibacter sp. 24]TDN95605.1 protein involved in gliding motility RemB [Salegentibacter sp. 24]
MKSYLFLLFLLISVNSKSQAQHNSQRFPQFPKCVDVDFLQKEACFKNTLRAFVLDNYQVPAEIRKEQYKGEVRVIFEVNQVGGFEIIYLDAVYPELKEEMVRVFELLPNIKPATYNSRPISVQFKMPIKIPLVQSLEFSENEDSADIMPQVKEDIVINEYDEIQPGEFTRPRYESQINIPLSHEYYSRFDAEFNRIGLNTHSASKPLLFSEVSKYYNFKAKENEMRLDVNSWVGRKLFNEHLVQYQTEDYWFTLDFALDLQLGKDFQQQSFDFTYNNTRALIFQGGLGANFNFYTVAYENQGRFAEYYNRFAASLRPDGGDPAIIPGRGIAKPFMDGGYDYPVAEGYLSYTPSKFFNIQFGHGKNFIGDGYRSLLMSDNASPYPYFKLNTTFWKLKYTNTWMSLRDVRPAVTSDGSFRTKYMANHYLSYNVTKRLNIGLFESVVWQNDNNRGFDLNYLNPIIFYRAIEFSTGARGGNAIIGLTSKYKLSNKINFYGQIIIDEFSTTDVFGGQQSWKNKLGYQLGIKYFNAFNIPGLFLQTEYNQVRPYTYSHNTGVLNYGHNNQSMAHLWGSNFREILAIARYKSNRWYGNAKFIYGKRGFDYNVAVNQAAYGGDIYSSERQRPFDTDVEIGQGNTTISFFSNIEVGYIINPATNLKLYGSYIYRNFNPEVKTPQNFDNTTSWVNFGLRTDIFNWYYDY